MTIAICRRCGRTMKVISRRLCSSCYGTVLYDGTLADYPRVTRCRVDFAEDFKVLAARGMSQEEIAAAMGYTVKSLERLACRARAAGLDLPRPPRCAVTL